MLTETFDESTNNKHVEISSETLDGSGTSKHSDSNPEILDGSESSASSEGIIHVTFGCEREDPEILGTDDNNYPVTHINDTYGVLDPAVSSSSSSSSESSSNNVFKARKVKFAEPEASNFPSSDECSDVSPESSIQSEADNSSSTSTSISEVCDSTYFHVVTSPTAIPPVQVMEYSSGYDHCRIPSSAFANNTNPADWSNGSNDSLFSLHLGSSQSMDHGDAIIVHELDKSEESTESGEMNMVQPLPSVMIEDKDIGKKTVKMEDSQTAEMSDKDIKLEERPCESQIEVNNSHPAVVYELASVSHHAHSNGKKSRSSALSR